MKTRTAPALPAWTRGLTATVAGDTIVLHPRRKPRHGWERRFRAAPGSSDELTVLRTMPNRFDAEEWQW